MTKGERVVQTGSISYPNIKVISTDNDIVRGQSYEKPKTNRIQIEFRGNSNYVPIGVRLSFFRNRIFGIDWRWLGTKIQNNWIVNINMS